MKICICDDDRAVHEEIRNFLSPFFTADSMPEIKNFFSGDSLISSINSGECDFNILFLDIEMDGINGIETANKIRKTGNPEKIIIFVSSHKEYVFDAFRCEALHFIVKPITAFEFNDVFRRALHKYRLLHNKYYISRNGQRDTLRISDIVFVEGYKRQIKVHTYDGNIYLQSGKVSDATAALAPHGFLLIHQSFLVNMDCIKKFGSTEITLSDGSIVPIAGRKRPKALLCYDEYIRERKW